MNVRLALFRVALVVSIAVAGWTAVALAQSNAPALPAAVDPAADKILGKTCQTLGTADAFSFHADVMFDQVLPGTVNVQ